MKKKIRVKLKERVVKNKEDLIEKEAIELQNEINEVLKNYGNSELREVGDEIDLELKKVFKRYSDFTYYGLHSEHGTWEDLLVLFKHKDDK